MRWVCRLPKPFLGYGQGKLNIREVFSSGFVLTNFSQLLLTRLLRLVRVKKPPPNRQPGEAAPSVL